MSQLPSISISEKDRRTLWAGAITVVLVVAIGRGLPALRRWTELTSSSTLRVIERERRAEALIRSGSAIQSALRSERTRLAQVDSMLLTAASPASATSALVDEVMVSSEAASTTLGSIQPSADSSHGGVLIRTTARVSVSGNVEHIADFISALEQGPSLLAVRELSIVRAEGALQPGQQPLRAELLVEGLAHVEKTAASTPARP